ncbi:glucokinase [Jannaschia sp.]|nr:glucokinase [Jannaschia sp.]
MTDDLYLLADVGGTNTRVALSRGRDIMPDTVRKYANRDFANLAPTLQHYRAEEGCPTPDGACVCVAGPISNGVGSLTNLDWCIDEAQLADATGAATCAILNDLQAQGHALGHLPEDATEIVIDGPSVSGARLVIGIGTGFNAAPVHETAHGRIVPASEAGHASLPVRTEAEMRLSTFVSSSHGFPAIEDVLSGRGLERVYKWLSTEAGGTSECTAAEIMARIDSDPRAEAALRQFIRTMGTVAGNLALDHLPLGGIYLVGGVSRHVGPHLQDKGFAEAFRDKGRFAGLMESFPVSLIVDDFAALTGCAAYLSECRSS